MLRRKAIRKIFITTFTIFTLFVLYLIPAKLNKDQLKIDYDVEYMSQMGTNEIYLLGPNNYLVKTNVLLEDNNLETKIKSILHYLTINNNDRLPTGLKGIIPSTTKINSIQVENKIATIDFSKELLNCMDNLEERMIESITYSINNLKEIEGLKITVDQVPLNTLPKSKKKLPEILDKDFGINKVYDIDNRNGIQKVVLYYTDKISNNNYYVPVTKYVNDSRDKIKIIIDSLSSSYIYESNLMSYLNQNTKLIDFEQEEDSMILNFDNHIFNKNSILEEVIYTISHSVFDTYNVKEVKIKVEGKEVETIRQ